MTADEPVGTRWLIVADDLTGAADCAIAFAKRGTPATVGWGDRAEDGGIFSYDADSRGLSPTRAADRHRAVLARLFQPGRVLFKKIDSTLRGHAAAETVAAIEAVRARSGRAFGIFAPAFPATGRTTVDGRVQVDGEPLETTEVWRRDHGYPTADLVEILASADIAAGKIPLATIRGGKDTLRTALKTLAAQGDIVAVCDAETDEDLRRLAEASLPADEGTFFIGSAGLAHALAAIAPGDRPAPARLTPTGHGILIVVGSRAAASRAAARTLAATPGMHHVLVEAGILLDAAAGADRIELGRRVGDLLAAGEDVLVEIATGAEPDLSIGPRLVEGLADALAPVAPHIGGLAATGGETAAALLGRFGVDGIRLIDELGPGVSFGLTLGKVSLPIATKAGAFGGPDSLVRIARHLHLIRTEGIGMNRPTIAITMGDASGIGPEVIMKALAHPEVQAMCKPLVIGDAERLRTAGAIVGSALQVRSLDEPGEARFAPDTVDCIDLKLIPKDHPFGQVSPLSGEGAFRYIERAVRIVEAGQADGICTAPLSKEALHAAGHKYPGHTELLAHLTGTPEVSMMLTSPKLRVIHVTTHIGLIDAIAKIEPGLVERVIARAQSTLVKAGIAAPRIGVCAINPHAGENGLFGHGEEAEKITPAVAACQAKGWNVKGPLPADTLFFLAGRGDFDIVVAMYHDQGHGPIKVLGLEAGVNITIGLPVVRTSVDHGTAFDIAGKGIADERSLIEALRQAVELAPGQLAA
jgi:4-hydroxythreonine-4-phosphate dehydrogenase